MYIEDRKIEIINLAKSISVAGINLQSSGLPITFDSLGKMWGLYTEEIKSNTPNRLENGIEYGICLNKVPDYIVGIEVSQIEDLNQEYFKYVISAGSYIKASFNAKDHETLVGTNLMKMQKEAKKWAKENKVKCNPEYTVEVYPKITSDQDYFWMYILIPIK